jgi:hypothetical protein
MGTWGLLACGFFVGLCVGQLTLAFFLAVFRKDRAETITGLPAPDPETLVVVTPN